MKLKDQTAPTTIEKAREEAEMVASFLQHFPSKTSALLAADWQVRSIPFVFDHVDLYKEIAKRAGCYLVEVNRDDSGGIEHLLFMTRVLGLDDDQYLDCLDGKTPLDYTIPKVNQL
ncbi:MAG: hypothetical protein ABL962_13665 [Fimbriimonadaceae bacterium]